MISTLVALSSSSLAGDSLAAMSFQIPPQPLGRALTRFSEISGNTLLVDGVIVTGLRSAPLDGVFTPETALTRLLAGTGLEPRRLGKTTFTLNRTGDTAPNRLDRAQSEAAGPDTLAAIQQAVLATLCRSTNARPGEYGAVLHLSINGEGRVEWIEEAQTSGNVERDAALLSMLQGLKIDGWPAGVAQTVTVALQPQSSRTFPPCRF